MTYDVSQTILLSLNVRQSRPSLEPVEDSGCAGKISTPCETFEEYRSLGHPHFSVLTLTPEG